MEKRVLRFGGFRVNSNQVRKRKCPRGVIGGIFFRLIAIYLSDGLPFCLPKLPEDLPEKLPEICVAVTNYIAMTYDGRYWIRTSDFHRVKMAL